MFKKALQKSFETISQRKKEALLSQKKKRKFSFTISSNQRKR